MRSQVIKIKNIPQQEPPVHYIRVKPVTALSVMLGIGAGLLFTGTVWQVIGMSMIMFALFCLLLLPDRVLVVFNPKFMILNNCIDRSECMMIYWDEIVNWQYEWHPANDNLTITMVDGSMQIIELYSKRRVAKYLNMYAPNKEIKNVRIKEGKI